MKVFIIDRVREIEFDLGPLVGFFPIFELVDFLLEELEIERYTDFFGLATLTKSENVTRPAHLEIAHRDLITTTELTVLCEDHETFSFFA